MIYLIKTEKRKKGTRARSETGRPSQAVTAREAAVKLAAGTRRSARERSAGWRHGDVEHTPAAGRRCSGDSNRPIRNAPRRFLSDIGSTRYGRPKTGSAASGNQSSDAGDEVPRGEATDDGGDNDTETREGDKGTARCRSSPTTI